MANGQVLLEQLARLYGVQTAYRDAAGHRRQAASESLLAVLRALGAPVAGPADVAAALRERRQEVWRRCCEPVTVAWDKEAHLEPRLPAGRADGVVACRLEPEDGDARCWTCDLARLPALRAAEVEGVRYVVKRLALPPGLPRGYHRWWLALPGCSCDILVIAAPRWAYLLPEPGRTWGVFLPPYALHAGRNWGAGDLTDLEALLEWIGELGGGLAGTLPLLATFLDEPFDPSPYAPVSRLFWNEFYLDVTRLPELEHCPAARELLHSPALQREITVLRAAPLVDYRRGMAVKRRLLELLARCLPGDSPRHAALRRWAAAHPEAEDYARFRAAVERRRAPWPAWPARMRDGVYVRYRADEFYAILTLESHRHRTLLVGEDLGAVPRYVRAAMARHRIHRMYMLPFELPAEPGKPPRPVPPGAPRRRGRPAIFCGGSCCWPFRAAWQRSSGRPGCGS